MLILPIISLLCQKRRAYRFIPHSSLHEQQMTFSQSTEVQKSLRQTMCSHTSIRSEMCSKVSENSLEKMEPLYLRFIGRNIYLKLERSIRFITNTSVSILCMPLSISLHLQA